jgi:hypothetical protein
MVSVQTSVAWRQRGAATSSTMFLRFLGQSLGAAMFGAVLVASLSSRTPEASGALEQLMNPLRRAALDASDLARLTEATTVAMRHAYLLTGTLAMLVLLLPLTYPAGVGPASQVRQRQEGQCRRTVGISLRIPHHAAPPTSHAPGVVPAGSPSCRSTAFLATWMALSSEAWVGMISGGPWFRGQMSTRQRSPGSLGGWMANA